jgi:hypothetical protein
MKNYKKKSFENPYSGYYIEGNTLMLKFNNGSRELWYRQ